MLSHADNVAELRASLEAHPEAELRIVYEEEIEDLELEVADCSFTDDKILLRVGRK